MKRNTFLFVMGLLLIIFGGIGIVFGLIALLGVGLLSAAGLNIALLWLSAILYLVGAVVSFIAGILGVANAAKPEKVQICIVFGVLAVVASLLGTILNVVGGNSFDLVSMLLGAAPPVLYLIAAFMGKKTAG